MENKYLKQFKKGVLEIIVLKLLSEREMYGYELIASLGEKSQYLAMKEGTLYPILYRLENEELMKTRWEQSQARGVPKKYYCITDKGRNVLKDSVDLYLDFSQEMTRILDD